jgi:hypothetical protein
MSKIIKHRKEIVSIKGLKYRHRRICKKLFDLNKENPRIPITTSLVIQQSENSINNNIDNEETCDFPINMSNYINNDNFEISDNVINNNPETVQAFQKSLSEWSVKYNVPRSALTELLHILPTVIKGLPLDSRTLLKTPRKTPIRNVPPGNYVHIGIEKNLFFLLEKGTIRRNLILFDVNIDSVQIFKGSKENSFWVIMGRLVNANVVFVIGV